MIIQVLLRRWGTPDKMLDNVHNALAGECSVNLTEPIREGNMLFWGYKLVPIVTHEPLPTEPKEQP